MPAISGEIPLLPLPAVLFPGTFLPVQLLDDDQCALIRDCMRDGRRIGVIFTPRDIHGVRDAVPCTTGCLATVTSLADGGDDDDDDDPVGVVLFGEQRIRVVNYVQQDPYLTGQVEVLDEYIGTNSERRTQQAAQLFQQYLQLIREYYETEVLDYQLPSDPAQASYLLASVLSLPQEAKQRWLESVSTASRLDEEVAFLYAECEKHEVLLSLSQFMQCRYIPPNVDRYTQLASLN